MMSAAKGPGNGERGDLCPNWSEVKNDRCGGTMAPTDKVDPRFRDGVTWACRVCGYDVIVLPITHGVVVNVPEPTFDVTDITKIECLVTGCGLSAEGPSVEVDRWNSHGCPNLGVLQVEHETERQLTRWTDTDGYYEVNVTDASSGIPRRIFTTNPREN